MKNFDKKVNEGGYIICINNDDGRHSLTVGKLYKVLSFKVLSLSTSLYLISNDKGENINYFSWRFKSDIRTERKIKLNKIYEI